MLEIDKQNNILLTRGDTACIDFEDFIDIDGNPYKLEENDQIFFRLKTSRVLLTKSLSIDLSAQTATLLIEPRDTINLPMATHKYEIELVTHEDKHYTFIADKNFTIGKEQEVH
jgi:hypothetical protein